MENLKEKTARGLLWSAVNNGTMQVLNLVIGIILGRLLSPAEYGIVGVLTIFTAIAGALQASGFTQGLVNLKHPTDNDYNAVFWFNVSASILLYAVLFLCAPLIALFFKQPCLTEVSRLVFLTLPISAVGIACNGYMIKNMMNRELALLSIVSLVVSGATGISLALLGYSYWSLAWQQLVYITAVNVGRYYFTPWRPSLHIDMTPVRQMFSFCMKLLVTNIINILNQHLLTFFFGRLFTISAVGNYTQANKWNSMASSTVSGTIGQVAQPVLVSINDEREREVRVFRKLLRFTAFLTFPAMLGLALIARELILLTVGSQWEDSITLLQILCVGGAFLPFYTLYQNLTISKGRSDIYLWCNIGQIVMQLGIIVLLYQRGIITIVCAYSVFTIAWLFIWQAIAYRLTGIRLLDVLKDTLPFLLIALAVMVATYYLTALLTNNLLLIAARIAIAALLYIVAMRLTGAKVMAECVSFILKRQPAK